MDEGLAQPCAAAALAQRLGFLELCHDLFLAAGELLFLARTLPFARKTGSRANNRGDALFHARARGADNREDRQDDQDKRHARHAGKHEDLRHHLGDLARHCSPP